MIGDLSIVDLFKSSPTMVVLLACSIVTLGFAVERSLYFATTRVDAKRFMKDLAVKIRAGNTGGALEACNRSRGALPRVMAQGLRHVQMGREDLAQRVNTAIEVEQVEMERHLGILGTMSNIAPLLGLFGTVVGIIRAFADIARTGSGGSAVVAMGVAEALMTTAAGIVVAVIATVCFNLFVRRIRTRIMDMEDAREELFVLLQSQLPMPHAPVAQPQTTSRVASQQQEPAPAGFLS